MKLKVGKTYRARNGEKVRITEEGIACFYSDKLRAYSSCGECYESSNPLDTLISEWEDGALYDASGNPEHPAYVRDLGNYNNKEMKMTTTIGEQIERLEEKLEELRGRYVAMQEVEKGGVYVPEEGDRYWYVGGDGIVYATSWDARERLKIGNVYRTLAEAEEVARNRKIHRFLQEQTDFVSDWKDDQQWKWFIECDEVSMFGEDYCSTSSRGTCVYFQERGGAHDAREKAVIKFGRDAVGSYLTKGVM